MHRTYRLSELAVRPTVGPPTATHYRLAAAVGLILTVYGLLIPLRFRPMEFAEAREAFRSIAYFDPELLGARGDWIASVVQFAVLGFLVMGAIAVDRRRAVGFAAAALVAPSFLGLSLVLEFLQVYFPPRTISWNDVVLETVGGAAGVAAWLLAGQRLTSWSRRSLEVCGLPALAASLVPAYGLALLVVALMPFDFVVDVSEIAEKWREGKLHLWPVVSWSALPKAGLNLAAFFGLGVLATLGRKVPRFVRDVRGAFALGLAVAAAIEGFQFLVYTRHSDLLDVATGAAGVALGWEAARRFDPSRLSRRFAGLLARPDWPAAQALLVLAWFAAVAVLNWQPYDFTADPARFVLDGDLTDERTTVLGLRRLSLAPLVDYYWSSKYNAADQFVKKSLSFVPLGVLMGLQARPGSATLTVLAALAAGFVIELGQYFIPERHPSTSDILIGCFGAWLGLIVVRAFGTVLRTEPNPSRSQP